MMTSLEKIKEREQSLLCNTYGRYPLAVARAQGCRLYDFDGREYVDLLAGIAVTNLGHARADLADVMAEQARKLVHVSNLFYQEEQLDLAERLLATCAADRVFFCNSGADANEAAIKIARRYMRQVLKRDAYEIVTLENSFHGRTLATLTATGQGGRIKEGFGPLPEGFRTAPAGDLEAMRAILGEHTAAVLIEVVQGEGGVRPLSPEYVTGLAALCRERGVLLMVDEVQTGMGRTGRFWAHQHYGITPDVFTAAKALANGLPMGAMLCTAEVSKGFEPGCHATTFGGGAVLSAVASAVLDIMRRDHLPERAAELGERAKERFRALQAKHPARIVDVRGMGLMLGVELAGHGKAVWDALLARGFVCNLSHEKVLRLVPPLVIEEADLTAFAAALDEILAGLD
ncbi:MAG: aspartate aminotransferase family protein [Desulfovibrionaceae bacterium]